MLWPRTASSVGLEVWRSYHPSNWVKSLCLQFLASDSLRGQKLRSQPRTTLSHWASSNFCQNLEKCFLLWFLDTENSTYQMTASEAVEGGSLRSAQNTRSLKWLRSGIWSHGLERPRRSDWGRDFNPNTPIPHLLIKDPTTSSSTQTPKFSIA